MRPWKSPARLLTHWLLVWSDGGCEHIVVDGRAYDIGSGQCYLTQPGSLVELRSQRGNRPVWVHFDLAYDPRRAQHPQVHSYAPGLGSRRSWLQPRAPALFGVDLPVIIPKSQEPIMQVGMQVMLRQWQAGNQQAVRRAGIELGILLLALADQVAGGEQVFMTVEQRLQRAEAAVRAGLSAGAGLSSMANAAGLGRSRFCELYVRERGVSPGSFIRSLRRERAESLLQSSDLAIGEIAAQVGFADATVFGRFFRQATGLAPRAWKEQQVTC
jgi:AraC-like DNA-binding protein